MGKWMQHIIAPDAAPDPEPHIEPEDMARLAEGRVSDSERDRLIAHVNRCGDCYEILQETLHVLDRDVAVSDTRDRWWSGKTLYAVAASVLIAVFVGGHYFLKLQAPPQVIMASLSLDGELKDMLINSDSLHWKKGEDVQRFAGILKNRGIAVKSLKKVVLAKAYHPTKSLFGPKETLKIRIEKGVAYIEVVKEKKKK